MEFGSTSIYTTGNFVRVEFLEQMGPGKILQRNGKLYNVLFSSGTVAEDVSPKNMIEVPSSEYIEALLDQIKKWNKSITKYEEFKGTSASVDPIHDALSGGLEKATEERNSTINANLTLLNARVERALKELLNLKT